jgi:hypothetical protein
MPAPNPKRSDATGAGSEAAEGIHGASTDRDQSDHSSVEDVQADGDDRAGSEPLVDRETDQRGGYGGAGGKPVDSSDKRAKPSP